VERKHILVRIVTDMKSLHKMNKKALSTTVNVMLIILVTFAATAIVWGMVSNLVNKKLDDSASCYGIQGKILLNDEYTCYNATDQTLRFSISLKDVSPEEILISAQNDMNSTLVKITNNESIVENVVDYPLEADTNVSLPNQESGKSYTISGVDTKPIKIQIAPTMNGNNCDVVDTISPVVFCG